MSVKLYGFTIQPNLHKEFKTRCVTEGRDMSETVRELLKDWLQNAKIPCSECKDKFYPSSMYSLDGGMNWVCPNCWHTK